MAYDAHISGTGRLSGGEYNEVHISGSGHWDGPIHCKEMHVSGACSGTGNLTVMEDMHCSGSLRVGGHMDCGEIHISGSANVEGNVAGHSSVRVSGSLHCTTLYGGDVSISGGLNTRKDVEADSFHMSGAGEIHGLLNAEEIDITVSGIPRTIKIGQIGGSEICIRPSTSVSLLGRLFGNKTTGVAQVGEIEGDEIDLASTTADVVRGTNVILREGCHIRRVEYTGDLVLEGDAQVDEKVQV